MWRLNWILTIKGVWFIIDYSLPNVKFCLFLEILNLSKISLKPLQLTYYRLRKNYIFCYRCALSTQVDCALHLTKQLNNITVSDQKWTYKKLSFFSHKIGSPILSICVVNINLYICEKTKWFSAHGAYYKYRSVYSCNHES